MSYDIFSDNLFVVVSMFALSMSIPFAFIINNSLLLSPRSYLKPTLKDLTFTLVPSKRLKLYLSSISSRSKLLEFDRLYLKVGPANMLIGPRTLYPNIIGTWISVYL